MKRIYFFLLLALSIVSIQCKKPACVENSGAPIINKRMIQTFTQIHLQDNINLILTQEVEQAITVEAGQNIIPNITTVVENGVLTIRNEGTCKWLKMPDTQINVYVSVKHLEKLDYEGSGNVTSTNTIHTSNFNLISQKGAGNINMQINATNTNIQLEGENPDIILTGISDYCSISVDPRSSINLSNFEVRSMSAEYRSIRDGFINVSEKLQVNVYHTGNLFYKGAPIQVTPIYYGSGRLIKAI